MTLEEFNEKIGIPALIKILEQEKEKSDNYWRGFFDASDDKPWDENETEDWKSGYSQCRDDESYGTEIEYNDENET